MWPGRSYFPDFNHPNASAFWEEGLRNITRLYQIEQGGIWIDMNEFSNFVQGEILPDGSNDPPTKDYPYNPCGNMINNYFCSFRKTYGLPKQS